MAQDSAPSGAMDPAMAPIVPPPVQPQTLPAPTVKPSVKPEAAAPVATARSIEPPRIPSVTERAAEAPAVASVERTRSATRSAPTRSASVDRPAPDAVAPAASVADEAMIADAETVAPVAAAESIDTTRTAEASSEPALGEEELALAALVGLLGLGALGGVLVARRRRKPDTDAPAADAVEAEPEVAPVAAPAIAPTEPEAPARKAVPLGESRVTPAATGSLVDQIDYTKPAGYYESMVDQGPSAINPFLTRRKRIARAKFLDRELERAEERKLAETSGEDFATRLRRPALV